MLILENQQAGKNMDTKKFSDRHKEYQLIRKIVKWRGYSKDNDFFDIHIRDANDSFISVAKPTGKCVNILYEGDPNDISNELIDTHFKTYENGDGPWLRLCEKGESCWGDSEEAVIRGRKESVASYIEGLGNPSKVYIYEIHLQKPQ